MRRSRSVASAAALIVVAGCSLQPNAIVPEDGAAVDGDTSVSDTRPDGPRPDGGPTCSALSAPHIVEILAGDALLRAPDAVFEGTEIEPPGNVTLQVSAYRHGAWAVDGYDAELLNDPPNLPDLVGGTPRMRTFRSAIDTDLGGGELPYGLVLDADDRYTIEIAGELYLTAGDNEVHIDVDDRVVFAVDVVSVKRLPYKTLSDAYFPDWIDALGRIEAIDFDILAPGHGPLGDKSDVTAHRQYFEALHDAVLAAARDGQSLEQMQGSISLDAYKDWGQYEAWLPLNIEGLYNQISLHRRGN